MYKVNVEALQVHAMHTGQPELVPQSTWQLSMYCLWVCYVHGSKRHFLPHVEFFSLWPKFSPWLLYLTMATQTFSATINVVTLLYYFGLIGPVPRQAKKLWLNLQWNSIQHQMSSSVFWLVGVVLLESAQFHYNSSTHSVHDVTTAWRWGGGGGG